MNDLITLLILLCLVSDTTNIHDSTTPSIHHLDYCLVMCVHNKPPYNQAKKINMKKKWTKKLPQNAGFMSLLGVKDVGFELINEPTEYVCMHVVGMLL